MNVANWSDAVHWLEHPFCERLAQALLHFIWQGMAVGLWAYVLSSKLRRHSAAARYATHVAGLALMAACLPTTYLCLGLDAAGSATGPNRSAQPSIGHAGVASERADFAYRPTRSRATLVEPSHLEGLGRDGPAMGTVTAGRRDRSPSGETVNSRVGLAAVTTVAYVAGVSIMLLRLVVGLWGGHRLKRCAAPIEDVAVLRRIQLQARRLGFKSLPVIAYCHRVAVPVVVGILRPAILLPSSLASGLTPDQLEAIVIHELVHIRRYDLFVNLLQRIVESSLFFHPAAWYLSRQISIERENCCDDRVVSAGCPRMQYADALIRMAEICGSISDGTVAGHVATIAASGGTSSQFKRRVMRLLDGGGRPPIRLTRPGLVTVVATLLLAAGTPLYVQVWASPIRHQRPVADRSPASENLPTRADLYGDRLPSSAVARLGTLRFRQGNIVWGVAVSPDGKLIASVGDDNSLCLWDAESGRRLHRFQSRDWDVRSAVFSPDGRHLAAAGDDAIRVFDVGTRDEVHRFDVERVRRLCYTPDGKEWVVACGMYATRSGTMSDSIGEVRILNATTGRLRLTLNGHQGYVSSIAIAQESNVVATASHDNTVRLWDLSDGRQIHEWAILEGHTDPWLHYRQQSRVALSPSGATVAFSRPDHTIQIASTISGQGVRTLEGHTDHVSAMAFSPDGRQLVSGSHDETVRLWDAASGRPLHRADGHESWVESVAWSPLGNTVVSGGQDYTLRVWDTTTGKETLPFSAHGHWIFSVAISPDGRRAATGGCDGLLMWETTSGRQLYRIDAYRWIHSISFSSDGKMFAAGDGRNNVVLFESETGRVIREFRGHTKSVRFVRLMPGSRRLITASDDKSVRLWDATTGRMIRQSPLRIHDARQTAISPNGRMLAALDRDGFVRLANTATAKVLHELKHPGSRPRTMAFSPNGTLLVTAGHASLGSAFARREKPSSTAVALCLWDVQTGKEIRRFERLPQTIGWTEHGRREIDHVAFSRDGGTLATAEVDGSVVLYDVITGKLLRTLAGHTGNVAALSFSNDGRFLVSGGSDDLTALVWNVGASPAARNGNDRFNPLDTDRGKERAPDDDPRSITALKELGADIEYDDHQHATKVVLGLNDDGRVGGTTDDHLSHLTGLHHVRDLVIAGRDVTDAGLTNLHHLTNLASLQFVDAPITDAGLASLARMTALTRLGLAGAHIDGTGLARLTESTRLESLNLNGSTATDAVAGPVRQLIGLRELYLAKTRITDDGLGELRHVTGLSTLVLMNTRVTDAGLQHLANMTDLMSLDLGRTSITDAGLVHLQRIKSLETLTLAGTAVTDGGLPALVKLSNLKRLDLRGTLATEAGKSALRTAMPKCEIK